MRRSMTLLATAVLVLAFAAGCKPAPGETTATTTTATATSTTTAATTASTTTTAATTTVAATTAASGETTASSDPAVTTNAAPDVLFQPLAADILHKFDLNGDGNRDYIIYQVPDEISCILTVGGHSVIMDGENFLSGWLFLVDLDAGDDCLDLAVQELGPSDDPQVTFFCLAGQELINRGTVPGTLCDPYGDDIGSQPHGLGTVSLNGRGGLMALARGDILHTWFYDQPWRLLDSGLLAALPQTYIPMFSYDETTGERRSQTPVTLKVDLPLFATPDSDQPASLLVRENDKATLIKTDNREWVQLCTQDGQLGWFRLGDNRYSVMVGDSVLFSEEVFDGLTFAD